MIIGPVLDETYSFDTETKTIYDYDISEGFDIVIPSTIDGVAVEHIGDSAFYYKFLTSATIPDSVTTIGEEAFSHNNLISLTIPDGVTTIDIFAFFENNLTSVTIGKNVDIYDDKLTMGINAGFKSTYDGYGKLSGTYKYDYYWSKQ